MTRLDALTARSVLSRASMIISQLAFQAARLTVKSNGYCMSYCSFISATTECVSYCVLIIFQVIKATTSRLSLSLPMTDK